MEPFWSSGDLNTLVSSGRNPFLNMRRNVLVVCPYRRRENMGAQKSAVYLVGINSHLA